MRLPSVKVCFFVGFLVSSIVLGVGIYLEISMSLAPCPLCQLQRLCLLLVGTMFLLSTLLDPKKLAIKITAFLALLFVCLGIFVAGRHLYLQSLPAGEAPTCAAGLDYLLNTLPIAEVIKVTLRGNDICAEISWRFLGLSIPAWALVFFVLLGILGFVQIWRLQKRS